MPHTKEDLLKSKGFKICKESIKEPLLGKLLQGVKDSKSVAPKIQKIICG